MQDQPKPGDSLEIGEAPSATPQEPPHPALDSELGRALFNALRRRDQETPGSRLQAAPIYLGAKTVRWQLKTPENPEYICQAAHSIRELIDFLPEKFDVPILNHPDLVKRHREVIECWDQNGKPGADGSPNPARDVFEGLMTAMVDVDKQVRVTNQTRAEQLLVEMDVSKRPLPPDRASEQTKEWGLYRTYFVAVCHHRSTTTEGEFDGRLQSFEAFLIDRLRPRALEDQAPLRAIIERGEAGA